MCCRVTAAIEDLRSRKANVRCREMRVILESLGFTIKEGRANHKIVFHDGIQSFLSTSYDCGHGKDALIKPVYVGKVARVLSDHTRDLVEYLENMK